MQRLLRRAAVACALTFTATAGGAQRADGTANGEWRYYSGDNGAVAGGESSTNPGVKVR